MVDEAKPTYVPIRASTGGAKKAIVTFCGTKADNETDLAPGFSTRRFLNPFFPSIDCYQFPEGLIPQ
jgi:hypothetical protein